MMEIITPSIKLLPLFLSPLRVFSTTVCTKGFSFSCQTFLYAKNEIIPSISDNVIEKVTEWVTEKVTEWVTEKELANHSSQFLASKALICFQFTS